MSRIVKMKGVEEVIKSFALIGRTFRNARLQIAGTGCSGYIAELKRMIRSYGIATRVKFYLHPDDKMKFSIMRKAHILLHASVKEGWGLVVIEAASQATPSIVYNVPGLRESVKNNITGIVLHENTPRAMAENAVQLLHDSSRYQRFQKNCVQWARENSWVSSVRDSLNLIESL
jgi:glycosyltransferase involved in cell wall biosynthesis